MMGALFLAAAVAGDGWPDGLQVFLTGAAVGAVVGGFLAGVLGSVTRQPSTTRHEAT